MARASALALQAMYGYKGVIYHLTQFKGSRPAASKKDSHSLACHIQVLSKELKLGMAESKIYVLSMVYKKYSYQPPPPQVWA